MFTTAVRLDVDRFEALGSLQEAGQPDVVAELVGLFVDETAGWLTEARHAVDGGDLIGLGRLAHSLKGATATIGAERMRAVAAALEDALVAGRVADAPALVDALTEEFRHVRTALVSHAPAARREGASAAK